MKKLTFYRILSIMTGFCLFWSSQILADDYPDAKVIMLSYVKPLPSRDMQFSHFIDGIRRCPGNGQVILSGSELLFSAMTGFNPAKVTNPPQLVWKLSSAIPQGVCLNNAQDAVAGSYVNGQPMPYYPRAGGSMLYSFAASFPALNDLPSYGYQFVGCKNDTSLGQPAITCCFAKSGGDCSQFIH